MQELKNESGRSMVEMLGVLAIIGVLSIVGLTGYRQAMNKIKANEVVQLANTLYVQQLTAAAGACASLAATKVSTILDVPSLLGTNISMAVSCPGTDGTGGKVTVSGVDDDVLKQINNMGTSNPSITS